MGRRNRGDRSGSEGSERVPVSPGEEVEVRPEDSDEVRYEDRGDVRYEGTGDVRYEDRGDVRTGETVAYRETRREVGVGRSDVGVAEARRRFGGLDIPATLVGMLTALALTVLLGGLLGAIIGTIGFQRGIKGIAEELSIGGLIGGLLTLFVSFLIGGWAAARIARYDGAKNGIMTAVWAILLALILAALGAWLGDKFNVFQRLQQTGLQRPALPQFFSKDALTTGAILSGIGSLLAMLLGGWLGGKWGERYHRRADQTIAGTREGGIAAEERRVIRP